MCSIMIEMTQFYDDFQAQNNLIILNMKEIVQGIDPLIF